MSVLVEWVALLRAGKEFTVVPLGRAETLEDARVTAIERHGRLLLDVRSVLRWEESVRDLSARQRTARLASKYHLVDIAPDPFALEEVS